MELLVDLGSELVQFWLTHWTTLLIGLFVLAVLYWYGTQASRTVKAQFPGLPGPKGWPFIGNLPDLIRVEGQLHLLFDKYHKQFGGKTYAMNFFNLPSLVVSEPELLKAVFVKNFDCFHNRPAKFTLPEPLDLILSLARGETWRRIRNTLSPTFSAHKLKAMVPLMNMSCDTLVKKIDEVAESGKSFDMLRYQQALTLDVILSTVFGIQSDCQTNPDDPVMAQTANALQPNTALEIITNMILPIFPFGERFSRTNAVGRLVFKRLLDLRGFAKEVVEVRKNGKSTRKDMLDLMLTAANSNNESKGLTDDEIIANCIVFLLAGNETTSTTLSLVCYHLATNPDVQEKLQQEIDSVWTDEDKMPSYDTVHELPYLEMVISETLRLNPVGFFLMRECAKDCVIQGINIPKDAGIMVPVYSIHRDPKNYPDPDKFDPERFSAEAKQSRDPYTYLPFGHGPHNCIGMRFAQMEMKLVLVRILKKYSFRTTPETIIPPKAVAKATLTIAGGITLGVDKRG